MTPKQFCLALLDSNTPIESLPFYRTNLVNRSRRLMKEVLRSVLIGYLEDVRTKKGIMQVSEKQYTNKIMNSTFLALKTNYLFRKQGKTYDYFLPNIMYHGTTSKFLDQIERDGFRISESGKCWEPHTNDQKAEKVCLTDSMHIAEYYAEHSVGRHGGDPVVLEIHVKDIVGKSKVRYELTGGEGAIHLTKEIFFTFDIPSKNIYNWYVVPKKSAFYFLLLDQEEIISWLRSWDDYYI